ncbi:alpha/beta-hydrolase [Byssothecium circinans]|uniref:Alpha/beta-hydrolase n=1 Tax=Byssothecium circinans TaxID=147558 RepID=A0A6A5U5F8_9PLEO|nr:alpha/beta-hydrolase [Byssothecium circinans]
MPPILSYHPFKGIATLIFILSAPPYLALLSLIYSVRAFRPIRKWSFKTALGTAWLRLFYHYTVLVRLRPFYANPAKLKERYVLVHPGPSEIYTGVLNHDTIKPTPVPAIWFPKPPAGGEKAPVVIHFQGGAFVAATDPVETGELPSRIFKEKLGGATTFYAQYRVSRDDKTRFPAALQDAVTFYRYVLDQNVDASNIIISGDSAGGALVVALLRYIEEHDTLLPSPRGVMAWSPWVDISHDAPSRYKTTPRLRTDFLPLSLPKWGREAYSPVLRTEQTEPYLTQSTHPFATKTPLFLQAGTAELIYDEVREFAEKMKSIKGNDICYWEVQNAPHDIILAGGYTGFVKEAEEAAERAGEHFGLLG